MFDPSVGVWLEEDPERFGAGDTNLRRYVWNNPENFIDPTGLEAGTPPGGTGAPTGYGPPDAAAGSGAAPTGATLTRKDGGTPLYVEPKVLQEIADKHNVSTGFAREVLARWWDALPADQAQRRAQDFQAVFTSAEGARSYLAGQGADAAQIQELPSGEQAKAHQIDAYAAAAFNRVLRPAEVAAFQEFLRQAAILFRLQQQVMELRRQLAEEYQAELNKGQEAAERWAQMQASIRARKLRQAEEEERKYREAVQEKYLKLLEEQAKFDRELEAKVVRMRNVFEDEKQARRRRLAAEQKEAESRMTPLERATAHPRSRHDSEWGQALLDFRDFYDLYGPKMVLGNPVRGIDNVATANEKKNPLYAIAPDTMKEYDAYRRMDAGYFESGYMALAQQVPGVKAAFKGTEAYTGESLRGQDYGRTLDGTERTIRGLEATADALALALMLAGAVEWPGEGPAEALANGERAAGRGAPRGSHLHHDPMDGSIPGRVRQLQQPTTPIPQPKSSPSFWDYRSQAKGIGRFEFTEGYSTRRIPGAASDEVVYWVVNKETKQVLKVGRTTVGGAAGRWGQYLPLAREKGIEIEIEYVRFSEDVPRGGPTSPENLLRGEFERQGHKLPWDSSGKRNPNDFPEHP
jgi:hypothetical protein